MCQSLHLFCMTYSWTYHFNTEKPTTKNPQKTKTKRTVGYDTGSNVARLNSPVAWAGMYWRLNMQCSYFIPFFVLPRQQYFYFTEEPFSTLKLSERSIRCNWLKKTLNGHLWVLQNATELFYIFVIFIDRQLKPPKYFSVIAKKKRKKKSNFY